MSGGTAFFLGPTRAGPKLEAAVEALGIQIEHPSFDDLNSVAFKSYGGNGVLVVDERQPEALLAVGTAVAALMPTLLISADPDVVPEGILWLRRDSDIAGMASRIVEVLREPANVRSTPRVRTILPMDINGIPALARDVSLYGIAIDLVPGFIRGRHCEITAPMGDGATAHLTGEVIDVRGDKLVLSCAPNDAPDLLLWLHYLLGKLADSPVHSHASPAERLFPQAAQPAGSGPSEDS